MNAKSPPRPPLSIAPSLAADDDPPEEPTQLHPWLATRRALRARPRVQWRDGSGDHTMVLTERTLVGSASRAGIVVTDTTVSRIHAELEEIDGYVWVRDLGSKNGTYVDGVLIVHARVPQEGRVRVGSTELRIAWDAEAPEREIWPEPRFGPLVGRSAVMRELFAELDRVARSDASLLIRGETGTGKEVVARAVHEASPRALRPFVVIDCGALPEQLLEAELFGHARGAFTGAAQDRVGAFEAAEGGTIFIDEIGELPLAMQPKLLRVLESRSIRRVGETHQRPIKVRIISATHRDLREMVNAGAFREDLYFRLAVLPIQVPPVRDRPDDIELLVEHFLGGQAADISPSLLQDLVKRPWLGNVRELRNFVERAVAFGPSRALAMSSDRPPDTYRAPPSTPMQSSATPVAAEEDLALGYRTFRERWMERGEAEYVRRMLQKHHTAAVAAQAAGLDRTYFYKLMRRHGIASGR